MIHIKPTCRQTWGYHAIRAWYFAPALNHYRCIKAVTDDGAVRISDTFKFLHHCLPDPAITNTDRIIKATQHLIHTINGNTTAPPDELQAINHLKDLISGATSTQHTLNPIVDQASNPTDDATLLDPIPTPVHLTAEPPHSAPATPVHTNGPHIIPYDDTEYDPPIETAPRYNLRSRTHIISSASEPSSETTTRNTIVSAVIDNDTGNSLEYRQLIKHPKYKEMWTRSYANELGRLTNGIRDIPGTKTMQYIHKKDIPKDRLTNVAYSKIVVVE